MEDDLSPLHLRIGSTKYLRWIARVLIASSVLAWGISTAAVAKVSDWQRGACIIPDGAGDFEGEAFKQSLRNLKSVNANYVTFVIPFVQSNIYSTDIRRAWNAPTDNALGKAIDEAHSIGLKVNIIPHLNPEDGTWRIYINPEDRNAWFNNYENIILKPLATVAKDHGAEQFTIGTELGGMSSFRTHPSNGRYWRGMIQTVRDMYGGALTYSAQHDNPDEKNSIDWWDALDYIGVAAYHPSGSRLNDPQIENLIAEWQRWYEAEVQPIAEQFGKPVLFTEIGFRSVNGAHREPAGWWIEGAYDPGEQVRDYEAMFQTFSGKPNFVGVQLWDWKANPNAGGSGNKDFTPQNKPAENTISRWFSS